MKKLIPAIVLLLISAIVMSTASYAWFSMNTKVTVTGMQVKAVVNDNLLIAGDQLSSTAKKDDNLFSNSLTQEVNGILEPVSTVDGTTFFYTATDNVRASGDAINDAYIAYDLTEPATGTNATSYANKFSQNYGVSTTAAGNLYTGQTGAVGYVDYVFQLKATNTTDSPKDIKLTKLELGYDNANSETDDTKAYRVAIFVQDITSTTPTAAPGALTAIYTVSGATNFTQASSKEQAVNSTTTLGDVTYGYANIASVAETSTKYYKVVVRMWLEGEDKTCNNETFMLLTGEWKLDLEMELGGTTAAVQNISQTTFTTTP